MKINQKIKRIRNKKENIESKPQRSRKKLLHNKKNIITKWRDASFDQGHNKSWNSGLFENFKLKPRNVYLCSVCSPKIVQYS